MIPRAACASGEALAPPSHLTTEPATGPHARRRRRSSGRQVISCDWRRWFRSPRQATPLAAHRVAHWFRRADSLLCHTPEVEASVDPATTAIVRSPKLASSPGDGPPTPGSRYYAGYDPTFVSEVFRYLKLKRSAAVLDPWNGAGTTTAVAARAGRPSFGYDINPVLVLVAKSKVMGADATESREALTENILDRIDSMKVDDPTDPLCQWFTVGTAGVLRAMERSIQSLLIKAKQPVSFADAQSLDAVSNLAASFYVVLFETTRSFLRQFASTNPTWMKVPGPGTKRLSVSRRDLEGRFRTIEARMHKHLRQLHLNVDESPRTVLDIGSSTAINLDDASVEACVTSPPYCTRIDYPVLTRPELAILGIGGDAVMRRLRDASIGTTTIVGKNLEILPAWGDAAVAFLQAVEEHESKASKSYYLKYFLQYFDSMYGSLVELQRVLKPEAPCALVVQDSYYKDVQNDLAASLATMAVGLGWSSSERIDFAVTRTRAGNPSSRTYRSDFSATESLLVLRA